MKSVGESTMSPDLTTVSNFGGVSKSMLPLNEAIIDIKEG